MEDPTIKCERCNIIHNRSEMCYTELFDPDQEMHKIYWLCNKCQHEYFEHTKKFMLEKPAEPKIKRFNYWIRMADGEDTCIKTELNLTPEFLETHKWFDDGEGHVFNVPQITYLEKIKE